VKNKLRGLDVGGPGLLVALCQHGTHYIITIWSIDSSEQITYKCQLYFTGKGEGVFIDSNYISVFLWQDEEQSSTIHFISTETLNIERSLSTHGYMPSFSLNGTLALTNEEDCIW
jgi:hypothetical protein